MILWYIQEALNSILITYFSLCRFHIIFLTLYCRNFLKTIAFSKFFLQEEERDEGRLMWMSLVRSSLSRKPEKKGFNKNFLVAEFMCCEGQNFREIKI